jgi:VTC domain
MYKSEIHTLLSSFVPTGLNEMNEVSLMNRVETKYVFSAKRLPFLLDSLSTSYKVLEIDTIRIFPYHTTYLDTYDFLFYMQQVRGKLNRHKIRYRRYESTGLSFLEIKKKTNKNRTIKWRIENNLDINSPDENASAFIKEYMHDSFLDLRPVLIDKFTRITLVGTELKERITLDYNLNFSSPEGENSELPFLAIAELKRERHSGQPHIGKIMKQIGVHPNSFSKYCIGSALVKDMPRKNTLKQNLLLINKIENEYNKST